MNLKTCYRCKEEKQRSEFGKDKNRKDGLRYQCRECRKQHNREKIKHQRAQYYKENIERKRQYNEQYFKNLPAGVYNIKNTVTGKIYIGQSKTLKTRWTQHKGSLRRNKHGNPKLQEDYSKYGLDVFEFEVIKEFPYDTTSDVLLEEETRTITEYARRGESLYNYDVK